MDAVKLSSIHVNYFSVSAKSCNTTSPINFGNMLTNEISSQVTKLDPNYDYRRLSFGNEEVCFPPKDAPEWFQREWTEILNGLSERAELSVFLFSYTIEYGDWWSMYGLDGGEFTDAANARINRLGYAGTLELLINSQKHMMESNHDEAYDETLAALENLMTKVKESGDFSVDSQIARADLEFSAVRYKNELDGLVFYELATTGDGLSPSEFSRLQQFFKSTAVKFMPDGSILNIVSQNGHIKNYFRQQPNYSLFLNL